MKQLGFYIDVSACSGCKTCQVACKDKHDLAPGVRWRRVYEVEGGGWEKLGNAWKQDLCSYHVSMACNHCEHPVCLLACPNKAIIKNEDGVVLINSRRCMGCRYCEWTCPYGALQFDPVNKVMTKCTLCHDYIANGKAPVCVSACPMRVIEYGELETLKKAHPDHHNIFPLPMPVFTQPSLLVRPHRSQIRAENLTLRITNTEEVSNES